MRTVREILKDYENMKLDRARFDGIWQEIANRVDPSKATFFTKILNMSSLEQQKFDSSATRALPKFASIMKSIVCPRIKQWSKITTTNPEINEYFQEYFDSVNERINKYRYSNKSGFDNAVDTMFSGSALFGQMPFFVDNRQDGIYYRTFAMSDVYAKCNAYGEKDTFARKFCIDKRQTLQLFGENCPKKIQDSKDEFKKYEFIHYVCPNEEYNSDKEENRAMKYSSYYICVDTNEIVEFGGYHTMPYTMPRIDVFPTETVYGFGPAMICLADQKVLNAALRIIMRCGEMSAEPEYLVREDTVINPSQLGAAGSVIYGGIDEQGRPSVIQLPKTTNTNILEGIRNEFKQNIADSFCVALMQLLINDPTAKTATEVMVKKQEQTVLLAPMVTRMYNEWASACCLREFDICDRAGRLPPMPEDLQQELVYSGERLTIDFESPLDEAQQAEDAIKINRFLEAIAPVAQIDPSALGRINCDETIKIIGKSTGIKAKMLLTDIQMQAKKQAQIQQQQAAQLLQAMPVVSQSAKNISQAQVEAQSGIKLI